MGCRGMFSNHEWPIVEQYLIYGSVAIGSTVGMQIGRTSCGSFKWRSRCCCPDTNRPSSP